jgi:hypothetical protein
VGTSVRTSQEAHRYTVWALQPVLHRKHTDTMCEYFSSYLTGSTQVHCVSRMKRQTSLNTQFQLFVLNTTESRKCCAVNSRIRGVTEQVPRDGDVSRRWQEHLLVTLRHATQTKRFFSFQPLFSIPPPHPHLPVK